MKKIIRAIKKLDYESDKVLMLIFRSLRTFPKKLDKFLSKKFWNGLGVLITVGIAIMIFVISQNWEKARYEEALANIQLDTVDIVAPIREIVSDNNTRISFIRIEERAPNITPEKHDPAQGNRWLAVLHFVNIGPAPAGKFIIKIVYGGEGIEPIGMPRISAQEVYGEIHRGGTTFELDQLNDIKNYETEAEITINSLFIGSDIFIILEFSATESVDLDLKNSTMYRYCRWSFYDTMIEGYTLSDMEYLGIHSTLFKNFIRQIKIRGQYVKQTWEWEYPTILFGIQ